MLTRYRIFIKGFGDYQFDTENVSLFSRGCKVYISNPNLNQVVWVDDVLFYNTGGYEVVMSLDSSTLIPHVAALLRDYLT